MKLVDADRKGSKQFDNLLLVLFKYLLGIRSTIHFECSSGAGLCTAFISD